MGHELALQKLAELREAAPEDMADTLDGLAMFLKLRQDIEDPMIGAKVTYHYTDDDGEMQSQRAIVFEAGIAGLAEQTLWDPNRGEYTTPSDYPLGTVNIVLPTDPDDELGIDYTYDLRVETSVTPADGEPGGHTYTPGW